MRKDSGFLRGISLACLVMGLAILLLGSLLSVTIPPWKTTTQLVYHTHIYSGAIEIYWPPEETIVRTVHIILDSGEVIEMEYSPVVTPPAQTYQPVIEYVDTEAIVVSTPGQPLTNPPGQNMIFLGMIFEVGGICLLIVNRKKR